MEITRKEIGSIAVGIAAAFAIVHDIYQSIKVDKALDRVGLSVSDLIKRTDVEVDEAVVRSTLESAAKNEANRMMRVVKDDIKTTVAADMHKEAESAIHELYFPMKSEMESEMRRQIKSISPIEVDKLKRAIIEESKEAARSKVNSELDDAIDDAKRKIDDAVDEAKEELDDKAKELKETYDEKLEEMFDSFGDQLKTMKRVTNTLETKLMN